MSEDNLLRGTTSDSMEILNKFQTYLGVICPAMLFEGVAPSGAMENAMNTQESAEAMLRFVSTSECSVLLIERTDANSGKVQFGIGDLQRDFDVTFQLTLTVKIGVDVKMPVTSNVTAYLAIIKARESPLDLKFPLTNQVQVISMTIDREEEAQQDEVNQSFFTRLHQFTRHYYAPLARSARQNTQVLQARSAALLPPASLTCSLLTSSTVH